MSMSWNCSSHSQTEREATAGVPGGAPPSQELDSMSCTDIWRSLWLSNENVSNTVLCSESHSDVRYVSVSSNDVGNWCCSCQTQSRTSWNSGACYQFKITSITRVKLEFKSFFFVKICIPVSKEFRYQMFIFVQNIILPMKVKRAMCWAYDIWPKLVTVFNWISLRWKFYEHLMYKPTWNFLTRKRVRHFGQSSDSRCIWCLECVSFQKNESFSDANSRKKEKKWALYLLRFGIGDAAKAQGERMP